MRVFEMFPPHPFQEGFDVRSPSAALAGQWLGMDAASAGAEACASAGTVESSRAVRKWPSFIGRTSASFYRESPGYRESLGPDERLDEPPSLLRNSRKTECGAKQFLSGLAVRAAPFALLRNSRTTERGATQFLTRLVVRAAPFALLTNSPQN